MVTISGLALTGLLNPTLRGCSPFVSPFSPIPLTSPFLLDCFQCVYICTRMASFSHVCLIMCVLYSCYSYMFSGQLDMSTLPFEPHNQLNTTELSLLRSVRVSHSCLNLSLAACDSSKVFKLCA